MLIIVECLRPLSCEGNLGRTRKKMIILGDRERSDEQYKP
jgi:hypothetical protein